MTEPIKRKRYDKDLKRARDRFNSPKTQAALEEGILDVPGATVFDREHIVRELGKRKEQYKYVATAKQFCAQVVTWATRQAELTVRLRNMLPQVPTGGGYVSTILFLRLPEFEGTDDQFGEWVTATAKREHEGAEQLVQWITEHRHSVRRGIRKVLRHCIDLGVNDLWSEGVIRTKVSEEDDEAAAGESYPLDELESEVWREVALETDKILNSDEPIGDQLHWRGYWAAYAWKAARLREKETLHDKLVIGPNGLERITDNGNEDVEADVDLEEVGNLDYFVTPDLPKPRVLLWDGRDAERRWTDSDLARDLRRAGSFSANDLEEEVLTPLAA